MNLGLEGNVALVGGASRGLGRASAEALAGEGVKTVLVARAAERLKDAAHSIARAYRSDSHPFAADLSEPGACENAVDEAMKKFGRLDILVANAGGPKPGHVDELTD